MINLSGDKEIYIYGTRNIARTAFAYIKDEGLINKFRGFAVTSLSGNPDEIEGYNVEVFADINKPENFTFVIAVTKAHIEEIKLYLENAGVTDIVVWDIEEISKPVFSNMLSVCKKDRLCINDDPNDKTYMELFRIEDDGNDKNRMKYKVLPWENVPFYKYKETQRVIENFDFKGDYIRTFGEYRHIASLPAADAPHEYKDMFQIYKVCSHMDQKAQGAEDNDFLIPIQAGAALTDIKKCDIRDDFGENISDRNKTMAEMTAVYWIWKNAPKSEYKGICHYRRQFIVSPEEYCAIAGNDIDVVLNVPRFVLPNLGVHFTNGIVGLAGEGEVRDKEILMDIIKEKCPDYYESAVNHFNQPLIYPCNMMIAKQDVFDEYCKYAFDILLAFDDWFKDRGEDRDVKFAGYWSELITSVFFAHNKDRFRIAVADFKYYQGCKE